MNEMIETIGSDNRIAPIVVFLLLTSVITTIRVDVISSFITYNI